MNVSKKLSWKGKDELGGSRRGGDGYTSVFAESDSVFDPDGDVGVILKNKPSQSSSIGFQRGEGD